jgi:cyanophycin synthetase
MRVVEIRELDGPNIFLLEPAIKVELDLGEDSEFALCDRIAKTFGIEADELGLALIEAVGILHEQAGLESPSTILTPLEVEKHVALAFGWSHRRAAREIATAICEALTGTCRDIEGKSAEIAAIAAQFEDDDRPQLIRDSERRIPTLGITGTNGKTTTTRLIAHIAQVAGKHPGWCSTSGVYIDGEEVLEGDYTGPSGARRVFDDARVDLAVLETARGGILLRGLGYESNDVSVFTNVSADHLGLLGIESVEGLARVKSTVIAVTRPGGYAVLNARDPLVWAAREHTRATVFSISADPSLPEIAEHLQEGLPALVVEDSSFVWIRGDQRTEIARLENIPVTFGGRAEHMVENALCAAAAALALGIDPTDVRLGLQSFRSGSDQNPGRLNVYELNGVTVVLDYAHNEAGLSHLLKLARGLAGERGSVRMIVGAAGDRTDESITELARMAGAQADAVYLRETARYLRGRADNNALSQLYLNGLKLANREPVGIFPTEFDAVLKAIADSTTGDVVAAMAYEQPEVSRAWLVEQGAVAVS